jgi:hypothetical protein
VNPDFRDLLAAFNAHHVEFLVIGAHALAAHGHVRATEDLDVWIRPTRANAEHAMSALRAFDAPLPELTLDDLVTPGVVFQIGVAPVRINVLTEIDAVGFNEAWSERLQTRFCGQPVAVLSKEHLTTNKRAVGRTQDLADVEWLEENL